MSTTKISQKPMNFFILKFHQAKSKCPNMHYAKFMCESPAPVFEVGK